MLRKILLLICIAFVVVCYGYPCLILPFGSYTYEIEIEGETLESSMTFGFDGKYTYKLGELETEGYYKLSGNKIITSEDETFETETEIQITNLYTIGSYKNNIGMYAAIGVGALALVLVLTIPRRKN